MSVAVNEAMVSACVSIADVRAEMAEVLADVSKMLSIGN